MSRLEIVVLGAGGHAKVCIELLKSMGEHVAYCIGIQDSEDTCLGIPVLKGDDNLSSLRSEGFSKIFVAIGSNSLRKRLGELAIKQGYSLVNAISPNAYISPSAKIGMGVAVMAGVVINADSSIGDFSIINTSATVDHDCEIGEAVHIAPHATLAGTVVVNDYALLGVGAKVIPNIVIGKSSIIGAGSVVISNIPPHSTAIGVPAVVKGTANLSVRENKVKRIMVAQPKMAGNERKYVLDCLDTNWISSNGKYIEAFEQRFAEFCGTKYAIATNNGTTALHLAMVGMGVQAGDEVIIPTVTYIATANAVRYCGGTPVLVDVCADTMNIDPMLIEGKITSKTRGILPVHLYGHPADMKAIKKIADKHGLWIVEDAAESHGAEVRGKKVGALGACATFSFFGNKILTTGEGGMITTDDAALAAKLRLHRGQGMDPNRRYWFSVVGYNYRMTNIQAAIGLAQMEGVEKALNDRAQLAEWYNDALSPLTDKIVLPEQAPWAKHVFWMYNIFLREGDENRRDEVMRQLDKMGIETRPVFYPLHILPPYKELSSYPVADEWSQRGINLPTHQDLTRADVEHVSLCLQNVLLEL